SALLAVRLVRSSLKRSHAAARFRMGQVARIVYRRSPVSNRTRLQIKDLVFSQFGFALKGTASYSDWAFKRSLGRSTVSEAVGGSHVKPETDASTWRHSYLELRAFSRWIQHERIYGFEPRSVPIIALCEQDAIERAGALAFFTHQNPKISIVIPVYGKFRL